MKKINHLKLIEMLSDQISYQEIAHFFDCTRSAIHNYIEYHEIQTEKTKPKINHDWNEIQKFYDENKTYKQCKEVYNFTRKEWKDAIKNNKIKTKKRIKRSIIWQISREKFIDIVNASASISDILVHLGFPRSGGNNHETIKKRLEFENINFIGLTKKARVKTNVQDRLYDGSSIKSSKLKEKLFKEKILEPKCNKCGLGEIWANEIISLQLDHINGKPTDNRLENLRILCPNCHSQTPTYAGKGKKAKTLLTKEIIEETNFNLIIPLTERIIIEKEQTFCKVCNAPNNKGETYCSIICAGKDRRKTDLDDDGILILLQNNNNNYSKTAREIGISDNAIRKRIKNLQNTQKS